MLAKRRRQIITDDAVQGELLFRAMVYWFFCLMVIEFLVFGWALMTGPARPLPVIVRESVVASAPAVFGSVLLLPLVLVDVLRVSARFVGPVQQVKHTLRQLAAGEPARRVYLRNNDFWQELAHYTNVVADEIERVPDGDDDEESYDLGEDFPCTDEASLVDTLV